MPVHGEVSSSTVVPENTKLRRPRNLFGPPNQEVSDPNPPPPIVIPSIVQSRANRPATISSILHSGDTSPPSIKKKPFSPAAKFRGLGCTAAASQQVSVPAVIRASADWERRKAKKKQKKGFLNGRNKNQGLGDGSNFGCNSSGSCVVAEDAWCGPGIGFSAADAECVVVVGRRNVAAGRGKVDGEKLGQRERPLVARRTINPEHLCFLDSDPPPFATSRSGLEVYGPGPRHHRHVRHPSPDGLAEIMMLHGSVLMGGRLDVLDRHRGWRLDVDNMTYEQLLELGDRIGYVNTGLKEDEISHCIRKIKLANINDLQNHFATKTDGKCTICQEEYQEDDELGKLECEHGYHIECITQWLAQKNICPVCKTEALART